MKHIVFLFSILFLLPFTSLVAQVRFVNEPDEKKMDVYIDNRLFTSYLYADTLRKPILYPIYTSSGKEITRGYPIKTREGEKTDHPHQVGLWFNFGDVEGLDFWNNSFAIPPEKLDKYGSIHFVRIENVDAVRGEFVVESDWKDSAGNVLLKETTTFRFEGKKYWRSIVRTTKLQAVEKDICLTENKEGLFALRVDRAFEGDISGVYRNKNGDERDSVWGKRSPWVCLSGKKEGEEISIVMLDHPDNVNYPAWAHARGYGLFALNNLGGTAFDKNASKTVVNIPKGETVIFKHRLLIKDGTFISNKEINKMQTFK